MGTYDLNPFKMIWNELRSVKLYAEGTEIPSIPYDLNINTRRISRPFFDLQKATGFYDSDSGNGISLNDYMDGYQILVNFYHFLQYTSVLICRHSRSLKVKMKLETPLFLQ